MRKTSLTTYGKLKNFGIKSHWKNGSNLSKMTENSTTSNLELILKTADAKKKTVSINPHSSYDQMIIELIQCILTITTTTMYHQYPLQSVMAAAI
jgi:hypothetical protein